MTWQHSHGGVHPAWASHQTAHQVQRCLIHGPLPSLQALESDLEDLNGQLCGCLQQRGVRQGHSEKESV